LDGTLTDPSVGIVRCIRHAFEGLGQVPPDDATLRGWIGPPLRNSFATLFPSAAEVDRAVTLYREAYAAGGIFECQVYDGIPELLASLREAGRRLIVCTAKPIVFARQVVERYALGGYFEAVAGPELDLLNYDKIQLLAKVVSDHGLESAGSAMVGDRRQDIEAAHANGLRGIGVLWGFGSEAELRAADADALAAAPADLGALLAR